MAEREVVNAIKELSTNQVNLSNAFQKMAERAANEEALRQIEVTKEIYAAASSASSNYTNLIIVAGFAGFLSLLNSLSAKMSALNLYICGFFITLSLLSFISFEVYKMISGSLNLNRVIMLMGNSKLTPVQALDKIKKETDNFNVVNRRLWIFFLLSTIVTGGIATIFLLYSLVIHILVVMPLPQ
ncbi:hypothetical protein ACK33C_02590 [Aeromonas hydrophila]|uniref:hypothetical protein n=1 Tax=Aeromonas hydrophila TaxID=644 RepID=UPI003985BBDA